MRKLEIIIESISTFVGTAMLLIFLLNTVAQIVFRDVLIISAPWTEEMARFAFIWMVYFGVVAVQARKEHISMDFILNKIPFPIRRVMLKTYAIASILFLVIILKGAVSMLEHASRVPLSVAIPWLNASFLYIPLIITMPLNIFYLLIIVFSQTSAETGERMK
jgi:TRAP-type C4-dicarboxylate transport system permease small subunit